MAVFEKVPQAGILGNFQNGFFPRFVDTCAFPKGQLAIFQILRVGAEADFFFGFWEFSNFLKILLIFLSAQKAILAPLVMGGSRSYYYYYY